MPARSFTIAGHAWTYKQGTVFEALDKTKAAGGTALEVSLMGQRLSAELPGVEFNETLSEEHLLLLKQKIEETGVSIINAYIGSKLWAQIDDNQEDLRSVFEFGRRLAVTGFAGEPAERHWQMVDVLSAEYGFTFSVHNHVRGFGAPPLGSEYKYWDPTYTFGRMEEQKRSSLFGLCLDIGHVVRSGLDGFEVLERIAPRLKSLHLKDLAATGPDAHDCVYGRGIVDLPRILERLHAMEFMGHVAVEYEWFESPTFAADVQACMAYLRAWDGQ